MRPIKVTKNFINSAENSVLYESGNTKVLVTVSVSTRLPDWLLNSDKGWVTAEYNMLPGHQEIEYQENLMSQVGLKKFQD